jgi:hypothetical protein
MRIADLIFHVVTGARVRLVADVKNCAGNVVADSLTNFAMTGMSSATETGVRTGLADFSLDLD